MDERRRIPDLTLVANAFDELSDDRDGFLVALDRFHRQSDQPTYGKVIDPPFIPQVW